MGCKQEPVMAEFPLVPVKCLQSDQSGRWCEKTWVDPQGETIKCYRPWQEKLKLIGSNADAGNERKEVHSHKENRKLLLTQTLVFYLWGSVASKCLIGFKWISTKTLCPAPPPLTSDSLLNIARTFKDLRRCCWHKGGVKIIAPLVLKASLQTFQDAELSQTYAKFEQMFYFHLRGFVLGQTGHIGCNPL